MSQTGAFYQLKSHNFVTFENAHPKGGAFHVYVFYTEIRSRSTTVFCAILL